MINTLCTENASIYFFTDSQSSIENPTTDSSSVRLCKDKLNQLAGNNHVTISRIAGQSGQQGNVRADELANLGRSSERLYGVGIPISYILAGSITIHKERDGRPQLTISNHKLQQRDGHWGCRLD